MFLVPLQTGYNSVISGSCSGDIFIVMDSLDEGPGKVASGGRVCMT